MILMSTKEDGFFIRKEIGWSVREFSKINLRRIKKFIKKNIPEFPPLSIIKGMRNII